MSARHMSSMPNAATGTGSQGRIPPRRVTEDYLERLLYETEERRHDMYRMRAEGGIGRYVTAHTFLMAEIRRFGDQREADGRTIGRGGDDG